MASQNNWKLESINVNYHHADKVSKRKDVHKCTCIWNLCNKWSKYLKQEKIIVKHLPFQRYINLKMYGCYLLLLKPSIEPNFHNHTFPQFQIVFIVSIWRLNLGDISFNNILTGLLRTKDDKISIRGRFHKHCEIHSTTNITITQSLKVVKENHSYLL